ncbi:hypothetical protein ACW73L_09740 [Methylolobus aquaticus]
MRDTELRKQIFIGILSSLIVLFLIEPLLKWSAHTLMWAGEHVYAGFVNSIYRSAALGLREKFSFNAMAILMSAVTGIYMAILMRALPTTLMQRAKFRLNRSLVIFIAVVAVSLGLSSVTSEFIELQLNASFNQRLAVLAARAQEQDIRDLRARWALMQARSDYESLLTEMDQLAGKLGQPLPIALWR